ncbi:hypothetical protein JCGZ_01841 [Jatropha curcas]|uniref:Uncharacterized protein n=1 Tax=Jatropha curcas TaxID=180498 RepID=A0A067JTQ8_JATCU|nr:hypothetical protein JCGZ_01841 [Jatropha curcas]
MLGGQLSATWYQSLMPETPFATVTIGRRRSTVLMETVTNNPIVQTSSLQLPPTCKQYLTDKIDNLVEISHIPESAQIQNSLVPILNPYAVFKRSPSLSRHLRQIISRPSVNIKEYVQSSSLSQCVLSSTPAEQYVTLEIPEQFISQWKKQKYTHLHFGAIHLVLSYHGRRGLPVTARLSLLNTRYLQQLPREELEKLIPSAWITNYEKLHQLPQPVQQQDPIFVCQLDKSVRISFLPSSSELRHSVSLIQPVKSKPLKHAPIHSFAHTGKEIYAAKNDGHFLWDTNPHMCDPDCPCKYEDDGWLDDAEVTITKIESQPLLRKTQSCRPSTQKRPFADDDDAPPPWVGLPKAKNKPMTKDHYLKRCFEILAEEGLLKCPPPPTICSCSLEAYQTPSAPAPPLSCCMLQPEDFPPLETIRDSTSRVTASPYV